MRRLRFIFVPGLAAALAVGCLLSIDFQSLTSERGADVGGDGSGEEIATDAAGDGADVPDVPAHCLDKEAGAGESDIDCGGTCPLKCGGGKKCAGPSDCLSGNCVSGKCADCPADMVRVRIVTGSTAIVYCVDSDEVSIGDYEAFVKAVPSPSMVKSLPTGCSSKTSFVAGYVDAGVDAGGPSMPVRWVDYCDAWAYCDWAGKRLCGQIGGKAGNPYDKANDPASGQWRRACSPEKGVGDASVWPYGASASPDLCHTKDRDTGVPDGPPPDAARESGTQPGCKGVSGELNAALYDMSGNVAEWEDSCSPSFVSCLVRGGSFRETSKEASCASAMPKDPFTRSDAIGFRCCRQ